MTTNKTYFPLYYVVAGTLVSLTGLAPQVQAQSLTPELVADAAATPDPETTTLPVIIVEGRAPMPEEKRLDETAPVLRVGRETFETQPNGARVNDIAKRIVGIYTGGAPGEDKDARLRGLDKEFTRTTVDNIPLPDGGEKRELNLDRLPSGLVEEVRVIRLPTAENEPDGLAGRIDLKTRAIPEKRRIEGSVAIGGQDSLGTDAYLTDFSYGERLNERFGLQIAGSRDRVPNLKLKDKWTAAGVRSEHEHDDKPTTYTDLQADFGFFREATEIHFKPLYLDSDEDHDKTKSKYNASGTLTGTEREVESPDRITKGATLAFSHTLSNDIALKGEAGGFLGEEDKDKTKYVFNAAGVETLANRETESEHKTHDIWLAKGDVTIPFATGTIDHEVKFGLSTRWRDRDRTKDKTKGGVAQTLSPKDQYKLDETYLAGFVQNELGFFDDELTLTPGLRLESVSLDATSGDGINRDSEFVDLLPSLPVAWRPAKDWIVHGGVARLVNRPKFDELAPYDDDSGSGNIKRGNPDLEPAYAWAAELGLDYVTKPLFLGGNLFHRWVDGVIETRLTGEVISGRAVEQALNVGDGTVHGIELEQRFDLSWFGWAPLNGFRLTANESVIESQLTDAAGVEQPFKDQPHYILNGMVDWEHPRWRTTVSLAVRHIDGIEQKRFGHEDRPSETFVDVRLAQPVHERLTVFFEGQNVTDQDRVKYKSDGSVEREETGALYLIGLTAKF